MADLYYHPHPRQVGLHPVRNVTNPSHNLGHKRRARAGLFGEYSTHFYDVDSEVG